MRKQDGKLAKYNLKPKRKVNGWVLLSKLGSGGGMERYGSVKMTRKRSMPSNSLSLVVMVLLMKGLQMRWILWSNIKEFMVCFL